MIKTLDINKDDIPNILNGMKKDGPKNNLSEAVRRCNNLILRMNRL